MVGLSSMAARLRPHGRRMLASTRGRLVEPRVASSQALALPKAVATGTYTLEAVEVAKADMPSRQAFFDRTKQSALEHLEARIETCAPSNAAERERLAAELDELRGRDDPLGVLLTRPDTGELLPGDLVKVRILEMDHASRYVKCSRVYPRKVSVRVVQDPDVDLLTSAAASNGAMTVMAYAKDNAKAGDGAAQ